MALLQTRWKLTLDIPGFLCWCLIALVFPLGFGTISLLSGLKCLLFLFVSLGLGEILLGNLVFIRKIPSMLRTGFSMLIGTYLLFVIFILCPFPGLLYILAGLLVIVLFISGNFTRKFDRLGLAAILPVCLLLLHRTDIRLATSPVFVDVRGDYFYYNVLVVSLSRTLSIFDAVIHTGIPINYQSLTFFSPAALTYATGIPAHVALHGVFSPVAKVLSFSMMSASIVYLCQYIKGETSSAYSWKYYFGASVALLLIAPLHPIYIAKLDIKNFILLGEGYLLPIGVMGFALAVMLFGVLNFFFFSDEKKSYLEIGVFIIFLSSIAAIKLAMFFPLVAFYGLYAFIRFTKDRKDRKIVYVILSLIGGGILMKVFFGAGDGLVKNSLTLHEGYFPGLFSDALQKLHRTPTTLYLLAFFVLMFLLWMGLKILLFAGVFLSKKPHIPNARPIILAALGCVLIAILPGCFLKISMLDETGKLLQDDTFDSGQFMRAGLFISTAVAVMALLLLWGTQTAVTGRRLFQWAVMAWFTLTFVSFIAMMREAIQPPWTDAAWENQVVNDYQHLHPRLMGMLSDNKYSGQYLVIREVYPWWTCTKRGYSSGYVCTLKSNYRNTMIEQLLADSISKSAKGGIIRKMQAEGVDALVATPVNKAQFEQLLRDSLVSRPENSLWIYKIN